MQKYLYILLTNTGSVLSKSIKSYTKAPYNHVSISLDLYLNEIYSFGRKKRVPLFAGFVQENIVNGSYKLFPNTTCAIYKVPISHAQFHEISTILYFFNKNKNYYKYNFIGLIGITMNIKYQRNRAYFCSQFVAEVLQISEVIHTRKDPCFTTPDDFRKFFNNYLIYEGKLFEYPLLEDSTNEYILS